MLGRSIPMPEACSWRRRQTPVSAENPHPASPAASSPHAQLQLLLKAPARWSISRLVLKALQISLPLPDGFQNALPALLCGGGAWPGRHFNRIIGDKKKRLAGSAGLRLAKVSSDWFAFTCFRLPARAAVAWRSQLHPSVRYRYP